VNIENELQNAYRDWRRLAEAEGEAIRAGAWGFVHDCQEAIRRLQSRLSPLAETARLHWDQVGSDGALRRAALRDAVDQLIDLERQNQARLQLRRRILSERREGLEQASRNLRQLQKSYARPLPSKWSSLS
jgi:hypothetical protein